MLQVIIARADGNVEVAHAAKKKARSLQLQAEELSA